LDDKQSQIIDPSFFLYQPLDKHPNWSPRLELEHTIKAFFSASSLNDKHAICRFPARFFWITEKLQLDKHHFPQPQCQQFNTYLKSTNPKKVNIKFVAEDVNNVTTMLGHIYFEIIGKSRNKKTLKNAISYITPIGDKSSIQTFYEAFSGGDGFLTLQPSSKVENDYLYNQQRNVWTYPLQLNSSQIHKLMLHTWELKGINAGYYFIQHNCGTVFFDLLSSAIPELANNSYKSWITPLEYVQLINKLGYINLSQKRVDLSPQYAIRAVSDQMDENLKKSALKLTTNPKKHTSVLHPLSPKQKIKTLFLTQQVLLNTLINNQDNIEAPEIQKKLNIINALLEGNNTITVSSNKDPINAPPSSRITLGYLHNDSVYRSNKILLGFMPVNSFLTDNHSQYFNEYSLKLAHISIAYDEEKDTLNLYELDIYQFKSITPSNEFHSPLVTEVRVGAKQEYNKHLSPYLGWGIEGGLGYALSLYREDLLIYGQLNANIHYGTIPQSDEQISLKIIPELGMTMKQIGAMKSTFRSKYHIDYGHDSAYLQLDFRQSLFLSNNHTLLFSLNNKQTKKKKYTLWGIEFVYNL
jgi:hypothetical protein